MPRTRQCLQTFWVVRAWGGGNAAGIWWAEARDAAEYPGTHVLGGPAMRNCPAPHVNRAKAEKTPWCMSKVKPVSSLFYRFSTDGQSKAWYWKISGFSRTSRSLNRVRRKQPRNPIEQDQDTPPSPTGERRQPSVRRLSGPFTAQEHRGLGSKVVDCWLMPPFLPIQLESIITLRSSIVHSGANWLIPKHLLKIINTIKLQKPTNTVACCMTTFGRRRTACTMVVP